MLLGKRIIFVLDKIVLIFFTNFINLLNLLLEVEFLLDVDFHVLAKGRPIDLIVRWYFWQLIKMASVEIIGASCGVEPADTFVGRNASAFAATEIY